MSTSADPDAGTLGDGAVATFRALPYDHPVSRELVERVQHEYVQRYGGPDAAAVDPAEFLPPEGLFLVAEVGGRPAGCGAWRALEAEVAEIKRLYVEPGFRRRGLAQEIVTRLERSAAEAGFATVVLNTGDRQPEALALYARLGYRPVSGYGVYACSPGAVFLGKELGKDLGAGQAKGGAAWAS
jgi:GNAT superfamily N-acetyltransferase